MMPQAQRTPALATRPLGVVIGDTPLRLWGRDATERLRKQLTRAGADLASVGVDLTDAAAPSRAEPTLPRHDRMVLLRSDWVYHDAIVRALVASRSPVALMAADGECAAAAVPAVDAARLGAQLANGRAETLPQVTVDQLTHGYDEALRKREQPFLLRLTSRDIAAIEARIFAASYKGVTDLVTRFVWPRPALAVTRWCARRGVSPNMVTSVSLVCVLLAFWAFWRGEYAAGLVAAWCMTFLDTVDGKLARVTLSSSTWGNAFDHSIDLVHPPFWWWAWIKGLPASGVALESPRAVLAVIVAGYVLQRLEEGAFILSFKMDMHVWRRFDSFFRLITARRNPNLVILTAAVLVGRPDRGIEIVAVWVAACLLIHAVRIAQAAWARRAGPLQSWLDEAQRVPSRAPKISS